MRRNGIGLLIATILLSGCVKTVTLQDLNKEVRSHDHETVNWVRYAGTKDGYHYICNGHTLGADLYRIPEAEIRIHDPFPLTKDQQKWRPMKRRWMINGNPELDINGQQSVAPLPSAPQTGPSEGAR